VPRTRSTPAQRDNDLNSSNSRGKELYITRSHNANYMFMSHLHLLIALGPPNSIGSNFSLSLSRFFLSHLNLNIGTIRDSVPHPNVVNDQQITISDQ